MRKLRKCVMLEHRDANSKNGKNHMEKDLRQRAEEYIAKDYTDLSAMSHDKIQDLLYELQVHQIELQMQNESLLETQNELAQSNDRYASLYEFAPAGYATLDERFVIQKVNLKGTLLLGTKRRKLLGLRFTLCTAHEDRDNCHVFLKKALKTTEIMSEDFRLLGQDGNVFDGHIEVIAIEKKTNGPSALQLVFYDVSGEKEIARKLQESEERYKFLYNESMAINAIIGFDGTILDVNKSAIRLLGYAKEEIVGKNFLQFVSKNQHTQIKEMMRSVFEDNKTIQMDTKVIHKSGAYRIILNTPGRALLYRNGIPYAAVFSAMDITTQYLEKKVLESTVEHQATRLATTKDSMERLSEKKQEVEEELSERQQALEAVYAMVTGFHSPIESIEEQIALSISKILTIQLVVILQINSGKVEHVTYFNDGVLSQDKQGNFPCSACNPMLEQGHSFQYTGNLRERFVDSVCFKKDDFKSYIGVPIVDTTAKSIGMICAMRLTENKFTENDIHLIEIFARYIATELSRKILETEVLHSREIKLLSQVTSGVAHEVRNPLNALMALSETLIKSIGDNRSYQEYLTRIKTQIKRLGHLMEELLSLGRPVNAVDFEEIPLADLVAGAIEAWKSIKPERADRIRIIGLSMAESIWVTVDLAKIQQVFINILDNSEYYTNNLDIITIEILNYKNLFAQILFRDTGTGISPDSLLKVFEPFYTKRKSGTGLGLCIVKNIIDYHKGKVLLFNNEPPPGLTVEISLPMVTVV